jgi:NADH-quinone oxidoreductase subunit N
MTTPDPSLFVGDWTVALPALVVAVTALVVMVADLVMTGPDRDGLAALGVVGLAGAAGAAVWLWPGTSDAFLGTLRADAWALFFTVLVCVAAALVLVMSVDALRAQPMPAGEYYTLVLLSTSGMVVLAAANDLIVLFLGLEVMSVAVYVLTGFLRREARSTEAALKYFLLGAFATGFLLYGIAFFYGAAGSTRLDAIAAAIARDGLGPFVLLGTALVLVGLAFKVALVPFHVWTPDVYEGAPTAVTAFMAVGVKAAAFAALARVLLTALGGVPEVWTELCWVLAALTMTVGNVTALRQRNVKRMLAYSSIAHAGYALVGLVAARADGGAALSFYLGAYALMNLGAFAVVLALGRRGEPNERLEDWAGVGFRHPVLGLSMATFMFSLAGFPPTAGFAGKFALFGAAVDAGYVGLAVIGVLNSLVSVAYYLGVVVQMYMAEGGRPVAAPASRPWLLATILVTVAGTLAVGVLPAPGLRLAETSFASLRPPARAPAVVRTGRPGPGAPAAH